MRVCGCGRPPRACRPAAFAEPPTTTLRQSPGPGRGRRRRAQALCQKDPPLRGLPMTSLAGITRLVVRFSPADPGSRAARELLARVSCARARAAFPDADVSHELLDAGPAVIEVTTEDKRTALLAADAPAAELARRVAAVGGSAGGGGDDPRVAALKAAKLAAGWGGAEGGYEAGVPAKVAIT